MRFRRAFAHAAPLRVYDKSESYGHPLVKLTESAQGPEFEEDGTPSVARAPLAALEKTGEFALEPPGLGHFVGNRCKTPARRITERPAKPLALRKPAAQCQNFGEREPQTLDDFDVAHGRERLSVVVAITAFGARLIDQALALIEADRLDADARLAGKLSDGSANGHATFQMTAYQPYHETESTGRRKGTVSCRSLGKVRVRSKAVADYLS
jgi:hypothetical protein